VVHQSSHVGVDVVAAPGRDRARAEYKTQTWVHRVDRLDPKLGSGYLVGSVARELTRAGRPAAVLRTAVQVMRRPHGVRWAPVLGAQTVVAAALAARRWPAHRRRP